MRCLTLSNSTLTRLMFRWKSSSLGSVIDRGFKDSDWNLHLWLIISWVGMMFLAPGRSIQFYLTSITCMDLSPIRIGGNGDCSRLLCRILLVFVELQINASRSTKLFYVVRASEPLQGHFDLISELGSGIQLDPLSKLVHIRISRPLCAVRWLNIYSRLFGWDPWYTRQNALYSIDPIQTQEWARKYQRDPL